MSPGASSNPAGAPRPPMLSASAEMESRMPRTPTPITTDLSVLRQGLNVDIESIAPLHAFSDEAYDVANSTITATVQVPEEKEYRLVLAGAIEGKTSAFVRVVSASDSKFKDLVKFKRIFKKDAEIIRPVLDKAGIALEPEKSEREQLEAHCRNFKIADITLPAGQQVLRIHASQKLNPLDGDPRRYSFTMYAPQLSLAPVSNVRLGATVVFPLDMQVAIDDPVIEAMPGQPPVNQVSTTSNPVQLGLQQAYGWAFQADPKITLTYVYN